jgi:endo-1,4-beta-xylanase
MLLTRELDQRRASPTANALVRTTLMLAFSFFVGTLSAEEPISNIDLDSLNSSIAEHRMGTITINAAPGVSVEIEQLRHEFWFGAAISSSPFENAYGKATSDQYKKVFLENFNAAVTENALKWRPMEPYKGRVNYNTVDAILDWTEANDIPLRGHCIYWGVPSSVQDWIKRLPDNQLEATLEARALDIGRRYGDRFAEFDLNNEMLHANYYEQRLGPDITRKMTDWVREAAPEAKLFVNDYDILTGRLVEDYIAQIERFQEQGCAFDGIGVQGHLHADTFDRAALQHSLDRLATLELPIRVTEFNMPGQHSSVFRNRGRTLTPEEEERKARDLVDYYRICFAHPSVEGILMWGFWEGANWIPASSLYRRDWTPTPAADAYQVLVHNEWNTSVEGRMNADGHYEARGFFGTYRIRVGDETRTMILEKATGSLVIDFTQ